MAYSKKPDTKKVVEKKEKLAKRTVQAIGFSFALALTIFKLYSPTSDIPWWVVFGFFGFGVSADFDINTFLGRK